MHRLQEKYIKEAIPAMKAKFGYKNDLAVPKLAKVSVNIGINQGKREQALMENMVKTLTKITGQKPVEAKAKKSISTFKIRAGTVIGYKVTLRGKRMYDFVDKLVNVTLPRIRDFRGLTAKSFDGKGNFSVGFKENVSFPEIRSDEVERLHGLEVAVNTTAKNNEEGLALLKLLGFPFQI